MVEPLKIAMHAIMIPISYLKSNGLWINVPLFKEREKKLYSILYIHKRDEDLKKKSKKFSHAQLFH